MDADAVETTAEAPVDAEAVVEEIFARDTWSAQECQELYRTLFHMSRAADRFRARVNALAAEAPEPSGAAALKLGLAQYMLGDFEQAAKTLTAGTDNKDRRWYQAQCYRKLGRYAPAIENFERAADRGWDAGEAAVAVAQCRYLAGEVDEAASAVKTLADHNGLPGYHILRGMVLEGRGDYAGAAEAYNEALEIDEDNAEALFRLAYLHDMHGEEDQALELYGQCLAHPPINASAAINLAVLHEDAGRWDHAEQCLRLVLAADPNHPRAKLFLKDVQGSRSMYYDEEAERRSVQRNAVLDIPVTDFELSVRARNCLRKMDIYTLGDLLRVTEADLLGSKNFGETSLIEIKTMLAQKGLQLGQEVEPAPSQTAAPNPLERLVPAGIEESILSKPVSDVELSVRARRALDRLGIMTLGDLAARSESELLSCKNFGQTSLNEIKQRLAENGLSLRSG
ncbi:MAG: DNA-directed RNA polymerase subunit alpha C-terminal domain-containing protein [Planctomycetota bacterium]